MNQQRRVAMVSGGSRGIGRAVALELARDGYDVSFCYRSDEQAAGELEKSLTEIGARMLAVRADVVDPEAVRSWVSRTESALGPIDLVVNSAGITRDKPLLMMTDDEWHSVLDANLDGVYNVCRAAVFGMMKRKSGSIINISSVSGVYGNPTQTNYSASKAGIIGFSRALAKEVGRYQIRVNAVAPGFIDTDMTSGLSDKAKQNALAQIPLGRLGRAEEVAGLVSYLASDRAAYITAAVLQIDGGITI
ncbi:3-oxoacyl-[acyl-carrier-protein] reductase [Micromonospora sp. NPDC005220]|uniref:3-oxoacyl-[acyl-carrier-protein] reductase n=1 Tax=Micromonospora sp. NPDC005220 TaxID=3155589 RepID=UPI0033B5F72C